MEMLLNNYCLHSVYKHAHVIVHPILLPFIRLLFLNIHAALPTKQKQVEAYLLITVYYTIKKR